MEIAEHDHQHAIEIGVLNRAGRKTKQVRGERMNTKESPIDEALANANTLLAGGASAGAIGAAGLLLTGAVCPLCIIATPILLGVGMVQRIRATRKQKKRMGEELNGCH